MSPNKDNGVYLTSSQDFKYLSLIKGDLPKEVPFLDKPFGKQIGVATLKMKENKLIIEGKITDKKMLKKLGDKDGID